MSRWHPTPVPPFPPHIDRDAFGHWLSGFTDGEGCFQLTMYRKNRKGDVATFPHAKFTIGLRVDDAAILEAVRSYWSAGWLNLGKVTPNSVANAKPSVRLYVTKVSQLAEVLVPHFVRYPLRAKKANDFVIWKAGVELLYRVMQRPRRGSPTTFGGQLPRWAEDEKLEFSRLAVLLRGGRLCQDGAVADLLSILRPRERTLFDDTEAGG